MTTFAQQATALRSQSPTTLLLFRFGDEYRAFGDDAPAVLAAGGVAAPADADLGAVATLPCPQVPGTTPMDRLLAAGHRVGICEAYAGIAPRTKTPKTPKPAEARRVTPASPRGSQSRAAPTPPTPSRGLPVTTTPSNELPLSGPAAAVLADLLEQGREALAAANARAAAEVAAAAAAADGRRAQDSEDCDAAFAAAVPRALLAYASFSRPDPTGFAATLAVPGLDPVAIAFRSRRTRHGDSPPEWWPPGDWRAAGFVPDGDGYREFSVACGTLAEALAHAEEAARLRPLADAARVRAADAEDLRDLADLAGASAARQTAREVEAGEWFKGQRWFLTALTDFIDGRVAAADLSRPNGPRGRPE